MQPWRYLHESTLAETRIFNLVSRRFQHPKTGREADFYALRTNSWANIAAITAQQELVLVRQFRFGVEEFCLEFPGGIVDTGEDPAPAATRELLEETGYAGENLRAIGDIFPNPAIMNNRCYFFMVENATLQQPQNLDANEEIEVVVAPLDQVIEWSKEGRFSHALASVCLLKLLVALGRV